MSEAQIEERINTLENKKLEYESWINSKDAESTTYEYRQRVRQDIEKFNKDIIYNVANQEDIFKIIDECLEKNIDMENYYSQNINYDEKNDY